MGKTEYGHKIGNPYYILFKKEGIFFIQCLIITIKINN